MTMKILLLLFSTALAAIASAEIYKWVDDDGRVHYSDEPANKHKTQEVEIEPGPTEEDIEHALEKAESLKRRSRNEHIADQIEKEEQLVKEESRLVQKQHCLEARRKLAILQELHLPVYRDKNGQLRAKWTYDTYQGEREYLNDTMRASTIEQIRNEVVSNCVNPDDATEQELVRMQWIRSEHCAKHTVELEALEKPSSHAVDADLEKKRRLVKMYCD